MEISSAIKDLQEQRKNILENPRVSTPRLAEEPFKQVCGSLERFDPKSRAIAKFRVQQVLFEVEVPEDS